MTDKEFKEGKVYTLIEKLPAGAIINGLYPIKGGIGIDITYPIDYKEKKTLELKPPVQQLNSEER